MAWAQIHNVRFSPSNIATAVLICYDRDTLTIACWQAMDLMTDIHKAETHFLGITLRKNKETSNPRAMYSLADAQVLPLTLLADKYKYIATAHDERPVDVLEEYFWKDRKKRLADGALGSVLAMSFELAPGEEMTVEEAVAKVGCVVFAWSYDLCMTVSRVRKTCQYGNRWDSLEQPGIRCVLS